MKVSSLYSGRGSEAHRRRLTLRIDPQHETKHIERVRREREGYSVTMDDGFSLWLAEARTAPHVGDAICLYGKGFGYAVRGAVLIGHRGGKPFRQVVRYQTEVEQQRAHAVWVAKKEAEDRRRYEETRAERAAQYAALPPQFQKRIDRFRENNQEFGPKFEGYELFTLTQAAAFARALGSVEAVDYFKDLPCEQQRAMVPEMSDGHSGNTFGAACYFAKALLTDPTAGLHEHGALCPLVGCRDYGCVPREVQS